MGSTAERVALLSEPGEKVAGDHQHAEKQHTFIDESGKPASQARRLQPETAGAVRRWAHSGERVAGVPDERAAAPWGPRLGSSVFLSTKPWLAAILGSPGC